MYHTTDSDVSTDRFGDYVTIRQAPPTDANPGNLFAAFGFGVNKDPSSMTGAKPDVRYVLFGRPRRVATINQAGSGTIRSS